jgi:AraC family transcriptional regulator, arabinose operon regulatory protein
MKLEVIIINSNIQPFITEEKKLPFYVKLVGGNDTQEHISRLNGYPAHQWIHCVKGNGKLLIDGKEFIISKNSGFYLSSMLGHEYFALEEPWETHWIAFSGYEVEYFLNQLGLKDYAVFYFNDIKFLDNLLIEILNTAKTNTLTSGLRNSSKLYGFLIEIISTKRENIEETGSSMFKKILPILNYIEGNYNKTPTIDEMATIINTSPQYLCRLFKETLNMRPFAYLTKYRLQKSKELLINDLSLKICDISKFVGYNDESYFCLLFKKNEGVTPLEFRNMNKMH